MQHVCRHFVFYILEKYVPCFFSYVVEQDSPFQCKIIISIKHIFKTFIVCNLLCLLFYWCIATFNWQQITALCSRQQCVSRHPCGRVVHMHFSCISHACACRRCDRHMHHQKIAIQPTSGHNKLHRGPPLTTNCEQMINYKWMFIKIFIQMLLIIFFVTLKNFIILVLKGAIKAALS